MLPEKESNWYKVEEDNKKQKKKGTIEREGRLVRKEDSWEIMLWEGRSPLGVVQNGELTYPKALETSTKAAWNISGRELKHANEKEETKPE